MTAVLIFGVVLLAAVLLSALAHRSVLSSTVLFLAAGVTLGPLGAGSLRVDVHDPVVGRLAELALFSVLFTDALRVGVSDLVRAWRLPGRALLFGMPLTFAALWLFARALVGLSWGAAALIAAILTPTDPVFAAAIVGREEVPARLRHLLNVESGLNDGLALPVVIVLLARVGREDVHISRVLGELVLGILIGVAVPWIAIALERSRFFAASVEYEPLNAFAIGLIVLASSRLAGANEFLAAFAAGVTIATRSPAMRDAFSKFGELVAELLKLVAVLVFGALISRSLLGQVHLGGYLFCFAALLVARPAAIEVSLLRSKLDWRERAAASWFGPKGFASVVYGLLVLDSDIPDAGKIFALTAFVVAASMIAHASTDVVVAHWFGRVAQREGPTD
jgi:NhaP-type Na+/H+ or K+/H+ antiporter